MSFVATAVVASTAISVAGNIQKGQAAEQAANFNSDIKSQQANDAIREGAENERRQRIASGKQIGAARAAIGASGIKAEGSALDVLEESASNAELDALTIRHQAEMKAWSYRMGAQSSQMEGQSAKTQAGYGVASSLISGAGQLRSLSKDSSDWE